MYDLIISDAMVLDGEGTPARHADVAVKDGRVAEIGKITAQAREQVNADGLTLAPGVVDVHTHYDAQLTWEPTASPSTALGVTTVVMGNCGFGIAPCPPQTRDLIARNLSEVEGMPLSSLREGINWEFETFPEYLDLLRRQGTFPNVGVFVGHSTVRSGVMGEAASEREATPDEIDEMASQVRHAMDAGAIGFASSVSQNHNGYGGVPMPSRMASEDELRRLVGVLGETGKGVYQMTVGPTTTVPFLESLAQETKRPIIFSALFHNDEFPERAPGMLAQCRETMERGTPVYAQVGCQPLSMDFSLTNAYPMMSLDVWEPLRATDKETLARTFSDQEFRKRFRETLSKPVKGKIFYGYWDKVEIAQVAQRQNEAVEGKSVAEVAASRGVDPIDLFFDFALAEDLETAFTAKLLNTDEDVVDDLLRDPASLVSLSDAGAHLIFMCDAGYALKLLGHWTRERKTFELPEAVRQITSRPADIYGITDRGRIRPGAHADLLLFDPDTVDVGPTRRQFDLPGGSSRLVRDPVGLSGVWVNGTRVHDGKDYLDVAQAPGQVLDQFGN